MLDYVRQPEHFPFSYFLLNIQYGLGPIMKDLGVKLEKELPSGSLVVSNVFSVPGWTPVNSSLEGTHIYRIR